MRLISAENRSLYIDGRWRQGQGTTLGVLDPSNEERLAELSTAAPTDVHEALIAAREAQVTWARTPSMVRGGYLRQMAQIVEAHREELAALISREMGKPRTQALAEADFAATFLSYNAEWDRRLEGEVLPGDVAGEAIHILHAPVGVVGAICPWNFPLAVLCRKLGPALVTGNTVVVKPSEVSPLSTIRFFELVSSELDLPPGILNLVVGGPDSGRALVEDPVTSMISFTGHRDTGKSIMAAAAKTLTRVALELGGKAPAIVWRDADLDLAVGAIVSARHTNGGQVCTAAERVLVHRDIYDQFSSAYVAAVRKLSIGVPDGEVDLGPLASADQLAKTEQTVRTAVAEGGTVLTGGASPSGGLFSVGYWFEPTVLGDVRPEMSVMREETFGPVTPLLAIESISDGIDVANDSRYGLSAYLFSRDYQTVMRSVDELQFGEIYVNRTLGESVHAHHSGYRESGIGGEDGKWGLLRYTQIKTVYHHYGNLET